MRIKWYGTASLLIEGGCTRILVDPYLKQYNPALPHLPVEEAAAADAAVITHPHLDHFSDIGTFLQAGLKEVFVSENGIAHARDQGISVDRMTAIAANEQLCIGEMKVRILQSRHCRFDAATVLGVLFSRRTYLHAKDAISLLRQTKDFKITDDIYALEFIHEQKHIVVLGSAGMDENTQYPQGADLLVFPYQGRAGMHRYMRHFLEVFRPKAVMADHFDDAFPPLTSKIDMKKFAPVVQEMTGGRAIVPTENTWYEV